MAVAQSNTAEEREKLVGLALRIVEERGGQGLTLNELAARAGLSSAHLSRFFDSKDALLEAIAEHWFRPKVAIMDEVMASGLSARRKMFEFFARRFVVMRDAYLADPVTFQMYVETGDEHFELIRSYVDLADHYLGEIIGEAMGEGYFAGLGVDEAISLVNQMTALYTTIRVMPIVMDRLSVDKLARIIDAVFDGLSAQDRGAKSLSGLRAA